MNVRLLACGECGVLVEVADLAEVLALDGAIRPLVESRDDGWRTVVDLVPATRTLLVTVETPGELSEFIWNNKRLPMEGGAIAAKEVRNGEE